MDLLRRKILISLPGSGSGSGWAKKKKKDKM